jgi:ATP-dependent HslUV protease ATP-binding subunit HslU
MFRIRASIVRMSRVNFASSNRFPSTAPSSSSFSVRWQSSAAQSATDHQHPTELTKSSSLSSALKPKEVVDQLDKFIVGQLEAKKAVAIALRNRWRRHQLRGEMRNEVIPKNILMIGPTGCGKTEIARRIAKLSQAPFIKAEATKFTEVGFHGKDVDQMIRDLVDVSISMTKKRLKEQIKESIAKLVEDRIVAAVAGPSADESQLRTFREMVQAGLMETTEIMIDVPHRTPGGADDRIDVSNPTELFRALNKVVSGKPGSGSGMGGASGNGRGGQKRMTVAEARAVLEETESEKQLEQFDIPKEAIANVEENGIVFFDEIDKLISGDDYRSADASSEGVQRDLLPLIEGSTISTKHGNVNTDFILFIASGAFHSAKPSDLIAELQGRLPIRVTLQGLTEEDLYRILTEPVTNLIQQQVELLKSENVNLSFTDDAVREIARVAHEANLTMENIGARRLHTVIERVVEDVSFEAPDRQGENVVIDAAYVKQKVQVLLRAADLRKYIL